VEAGTRCCICKEDINRAIELHECAVCELTMHVRCRAVHAEDCVEVFVSFDQPTLKQSAKRRPAK
jgi:hypothetical protein